VEQDFDGLRTNGCARRVRKASLLSTAPWDSADDVIDGLLSVLSVGGSLVYVANPDPAALARKIETEKVTRNL